MGLQDSDLILVERSNTLKKVTYGDRANIASSDLFLVEATSTAGGREVGKLYKCTYADWSSANSTDLILVEADSTINGRVDGKLYKETKANWPTSSNVDIHSANYMVTLGTLLYGQSTSQRASNNFSVVEVQMEVSSSAAYADGDLYIGFRNTASTTYYGDLPIAAVQILHSDGSTVRVTDWHNCTWNFALGNTQAGYYDWATTRYEDTLESNPEDASGGYFGAPTYSFNSQTSSPPPEYRLKYRFSYTEIGTGSSYVGSARGISSSTYTGNPSTTSILPVGNANVSQSSSSSDGYLFSECSSTSQYDVTWLLLAFTGNIYNGDRIRICYFGGGNGQTSSNGLQTTDSLYLRFIEE